MMAFVVIALLDHVILGPRPLDQTQEMVSYMSGTHELHLFLADEAVVNQKVFEADSLKYGTLDHPDKIANLVLVYFLLALMLGCPHPGPCCIWPPTASGIGLESWVVSSTSNPEA